MLTIHVVLSDGFDESTSEFVPVEAFSLELEHSLASLSKWESIHEEPFLPKEVMSQEESLSYIKCMTLTPNVPEEVFQKLSDDDYMVINAYTNRKMTATWFAPERKNTTNSEVITAELIYYWMFSFGIPLEAENWHLNKLLTLIKVFGKKNEPEKKMSKADLAARNRALNEQRRRELGTKG